MHEILQKVQARLEQYQIAHEAAEVLLESMASQDEVGIDEFIEQYTGNVEGMDVLMHRVERTILLFWEYFNKRFPALDKKKNGGKQGRGPL